MKSIATGTGGIGGIGVKRKKKSSIMLGGLGARVTLGPRAPSDT